MCIEFVIQVLKQKNAHVSFPAGMVFRTNLMSAILPPATLGLEMAVPILSAPGIFVLFLLKKPSMPIKFVVLGGVLVFVGAYYISMGAGAF